MNGDNPPKPRQLDVARWERIQHVFHAAVELDAADREHLLKAECGDDAALLADVQAMLNEDAAATSLLDGDRSDLASRLLGAPALGLESGRFGAYRIVRLLGEGGSGVVYLAQRDDLGNLIAIKFLRDAWLSPSRRERFAAEQRTLAQLNHSSIARLYDAGTLDDGTPWFVMEYVDGLSLVEFCERHRSSLEERLRLFRGVCDAVAFAHRHNIIHRDLKPSNVLVKADGAVRLLDFGIAKQLAVSGDSLEHTHTALRLMTPAYASPEQIRGEHADVRSDIYSLGVILYQLIAGVLPFDFSVLTPGEALTLVVEHDPSRPSIAAQRIDARAGGIQPPGKSSWAELDVLCLTAMHKDPLRRYQSVDALIRDIDHFLNAEPLDAKPERAWYTLRKFAWRNRVRLSGAAAIILAIAVAWIVGRTTSIGATATDPAANGARRTVAVLPFRNAGADASLDFLKLALSDEIATMLSHIRSVSVRPSATTGKYDGIDVDPQRAGREMQASTVVTGHFMRTGQLLKITLEAIDVESNRSLWRDTLDVPADNLVATQTQIGLRVRGGLAAALGWPASTAGAAPSDEEAYGLFLRSGALTLDPDNNGPGIDMLERSVALDPRYPPAWVALARRYYVDSRYGTGSGATIGRYDTAMARALALDPEYIAAASGLALVRTERGDLVNAYRQAVDLVSRRPDSIDAHFVLSYVLRYAGLLDEAGAQCETAFLLDPHTQTSGLRSCAYVFLLRGDYPRAMNYVDLDHGSDFAKALSILILGRQGKLEEARAIGSPNIPQWNSYDLLLACMAHRPSFEVAALAAAVKPSDDPETNYFSAAHLAYCGQADRALALLDQSVRGNYCPYPALDSDPYFDGVRTRLEFDRIRSAAVACQQSFLARRGPGPP